MRKIPALVWLPAVFVVGGLVGHYGPYEELRAKKLHAQEEKSKPAGTDAFGSFARMVNIPAEAKHPRRQSVPESNAATPAAKETQTNTTSAAIRTESPQRRHARLSPEDLRARIDEAAELWRARVEIARASAVEKLGLDEEKSRAFGDALDNMNAKLRDSMQAMADEVAAAQSMTPELGVRLMGDLSSALAETYDEIGAFVGDDLRGEVSNMQLVEFIDPSVGEPLIPVQDMLGQGMPKGTR